MEIEEFKDYIKNKQREEECPVSRTLAIMNHKWTSLVIYELLKQDHIRFGELKKRLDGITNTMLSGTLKRLEAQKLVNRIQLNEIPPHVEYSLTESGRDMIYIYFEIAKWGERYLN